MAKKNVATHAGARRSESNANPYQPIRRNAYQKNEDPLHPGLKTVIVPKTDPRDPRAASPVGEYLGKGYKIVSEDPIETGHSDQVKLGIDLNVWLEREEERVTADNEALTNLIEQVEIGTAQGVRFERSQSGVTRSTANLGEMVSNLPNGPAVRQSPDDLD